MSHSTSEQVKMEIDSKARQAPPELGTAQNLDQVGLLELQGIDLIREDNMILDLNSVGGHDLSSKLILLFRVKCALADSYRSGMERWMRLRQRLDRGKALAFIL